MGVGVKVREKPHCLSNVAERILNVNKSLLSVCSGRMILDREPYCFFQVWENRLDQGHPGQDHQQVQR